MRTGPYLDLTGYVLMRVTQHPHIDIPAGKRVLIAVPVAARAGSRGRS